MQSLLCDSWACSRWRLDMSRLPALAARPLSIAKKSSWMSTRTCSKGNLMELEKNITEIVQTITKLVQPERVILFGSRARGVAHRYSDYDIALVGVTMDHRVERRLKEALDDKLGIFTVDLSGKCGNKLLWRIALAKIRLASCSIICCSSASMPTLGSVPGTCCCPALIE